MPYANKLDKTQYNARYRKTPKGSYNRAKGCAKHRKLSFELTLEQYTEIRKAPCYYCGSLITPQRGGLDRIDSSIGYTIENVRPCCRTCNQAKSDLSENDFKNHILKMHAHWASK